MITKNKDKSGIFRCKCGNIKEFFKKLPKEVKLAYFLILILFILVLGLNSYNKTNIKNWIHKNPEEILNSVNKFISSKQQEMAQERQKQAAASIKTKKAEIQDVKYSGVINPNGSVTIVKFFDYNCGYCRHVSKMVNKVAKENPNARFILKELPIMGEMSREASKTATAILIIAPNKYLTFYNSLMETGAQNIENIRNAVQKTGIKYSTIENTLRTQGNRIEEILNQNLELAASIGINGTPAFLVEDELMPGAIDENTLKDLIKRVKK
jgi:protein-disulfide isomerase